MAGDCIVLLPEGHNPKERGRHCTLTYRPHVIGGERALRMAAWRLAEQFTPFTAENIGIDGTFGEKGRMKVVLLGAPELDDMHLRISHFHESEWPHRPHVTLGCGGEHEPFDSVTFDAIAVWTPDDVWVHPLMGRAA